MFKMFEMSKLFKQNKNAGQGIIEVITSLAIIATALVGAVSLATYTIKTGTETREKVIATNLVQEGLEAVRNIRDTAWLQNPSDPGGAWNAFSAPPPRGTSRGIAYIGTNWSFSGGSTTETISGINFTRTITFFDTNPVDSNKILVKCDVSWPGGAPITAYDILTSWK